MLGATPGAVAGSLLNARARARRSCTNERNGATPVPGPTMMSPMLGSGSFNAPGSAQRATLLPGASPASHVLHRPCRLRLPGVVHSTTATSSCTLFGRRASEEAAENRRGCSLGANDSSMSSRRSATAPKSLSTSTTVRPSLRQYSCRSSLPAGEAKWRSRSMCS